MNSNLNRALLTWFDPTNGRTITVIANDDLRQSPAQMQLWVDSMNRHLVTSGAYANGSRYHLG
jgi:thiamine biosynthesis lipoprotein ApbE